jgi:plasmid stabilization system protein ParE
LAASRRVGLSAEARRDLRQTVDWYDRQRPGLGERFLQSLVDTLDLVTERPGAFPLVHLDIRRAIVRRFPYGVFFRLIGETIRVVAVMHLHRDPDTWRRRG